MKFAIAVVGLAFVASSLALPISMNNGLDLTPGSANTWQKVLVVCGQEVQVGVGMNLETMETALGAKMTVNNAGLSIPLSVGISGPISDLQSQKLQVGVGLEQEGKTMVSGLVAGNLKGQVEYRVDTWGQTSNNEKIGATLEGSGYKPKSLTAGFGAGSNVLRAKVEFNDKMIPSNFLVDAGAL